MSPASGSVAETGAPISAPASVFSGTCRDGAAAPKLGAVLPTGVTVTSAYPLSPRSFTARTRTVLTWLLVRPSIVAPAALAPSSPLSAISIQSLNDGLSPTPNRYWRLDTHVPAAEASQLRIAPPGLRVTARFAGVTGSANLNSLCTASPVSGWPSRLQIRAVSAVSHRV